MREAPTTISSRGGTRCKHRVRLAGKAAERETPPKSPSNDKSVAWKSPWLSHATSDHLRRSPVTRSTSWGHWFEPSGPMNEVRRGKERRGTDSQPFPTRGGRAV